MKKVLVLLCAMLLSLGMASNVQAVPLEDLFAGQTITAGDKTFSDWELEFLDFSGPAPDFSLIEVDPLEDQPFHPGLKFTTNNQLAVNGTDFIDLGFGFRVATVPGREIIDNSLELTGFQFAGDGGRIIIEEAIFDGNLTFLDDKFVEADNGFGNFDLFDSTEFAPQSNLFVEKNIFLEGEFFGDSVSLDMFEQRFSQVPEPATLTLFGIGMVGLSFMTRTRSKKGMGGRSVCV